MSRTPEPCPICDSALTADARSCPRGHSFCFDCYQRWEGEADYRVLTCPICRTPMQRTRPVPQPPTLNVFDYQISGSQYADSDDGHLSPGYFHPQPQYQPAAPPTNRHHRRRHTSARDSMRGWFHRRVENVTQAFSRSRIHDRFHQGRDRSSSHRRNHHSHEHRSERPQTSSHHLSNHRHHHNYRPHTSSRHVDAYESHLAHYQSDRRHGQQPYGYRPFGQNNFQAPAAFGSRRRPSDQDNQDALPTFNNWSFGRGRNEAYGATDDHHHYHRRPSHRHPSMEPQERARDNYSRRPSSRRDEYPRYP